MKNLSLILNGILIIAVGVLYFLHFSTSHLSSKIKGEGSGDIISGSRVAYIIEDSLMTHYNLFIDLADQLTKKQQSMESAYQLRAQNLQRDIDNYRQRAANMAPKDAQNIEAQLTQKQQNLYQYQQSLSQEMMDEQNKINDQLYEHVANFLKNYATSNGYEVVLNLKRGSGVLYGSDVLNITDKVIDGLNMEYTSEKAVSGSKPSSPVSKDKSK